MSGAECIKLPRIIIKNLHITLHYSEANSSSFMAILWEKV